ncbi:hypothetical protein EMMF5_004157 [Cystobasidiomycetes sp. EMM_F5]
MTGAISKLALGDWGYAHDDVPDLTDKVIVVTGGSAGIGFEVAKALLDHNAKVIITGQTTTIPDAKKAMTEKETMLHGSQVTGLKDPSKASNATWKPIEFEDLKAVHALSKSLASELDRLDVLICNAGIGVNHFTLTNDGFDRHLTINNLAHVVLINQLLPLMRKTSDKAPVGSVRIVGQSSELHRPEAMRDVKFSSIEEFKQDVGSASLYNRSKLGVILFDKALAQNVLDPNGDKIKVFSTHPGAVATGQQDQLPSAFGGVIGTALQAATKPIARSPEHGSLSILWASVAPEAADYPQGTYFTDPKEPGKETKQADDQELVQNFWKNSQEVVKQVIGQDGLIDWKK